MTRSHPSRSAARSFLCLVLTMIVWVFPPAFADEDRARLMSDMGTGLESIQDRPDWDDVEAGLRASIAREYRSPDYDEKQFFARYVEQVPPEALLDFLEREEATCHRQAHELGRAIFRQVQDINQALLICGNGCTNACMHGAIGEAFSDAPMPDADHQHSHVAHDQPGTDLKRLVQKMEGHCHEGPMARLHKRGNCAHAMGHALMLKTDHDIDAALEGCRLFSEAGMDYYCATGVFMQYMDNAMLLGTRQADVQRWGANYPCNQHLAFPAACYRYIVSEVQRTRGLGLEHLVMLCTQLPEGVRAGCFHGLGAAYTPLINNRPDMLQLVCSYGGPAERSLCIEGVVEKLADFDEAGAISACEGLSGEDAVVCEGAARGKMYRLDKPTMEWYRREAEMPHAAH